jgi:hypothetical protein
MKKTKYSSLIYILAVLILPCIITYFLYDKWFPFQLTGKQFLVFFIMYMVLGYGIVFFDKMIQYHRLDWKINVASALIGLTMILSISRISQGLYHHRPVSYLVLLTVVHLVILIMLNKKKNHPKK